MAVKPDVGPLLKAKRTEAGLTTRDFGKPFGLSSGMVSQLENNKILTPTLKTVAAVAKVLELPLLTVCAMYGYCDENDTKEANKLDTKQALIQALGNYGVPQYAIELVVSYAETQIFQSRLTEGAKELGISRQALLNNLDNFKFQFDESIKQYAPTLKKILTTDAEELFGAKEQE